MSHEVLKSTTIDQKSKFLKNDKLVLNRLQLYVIVLSYNPYFIPRRQVQNIKIYYWIGLSASISCLHIHPLLFFLTLY